LTEIDSSLGILGVQSSLHYAPDGQPAIAYLDDIANNLKFAAFNGEKLNLSIIDSEGDVGRFTSLAFPPTDNLPSLTGIIPARGLKSPPRHSSSAINKKNKPKGVINLLRGESTNRVTSLVFTLEKKVKA
jgi:hypothetical protein